MRTLACNDRYYGTNCSKKCQTNCKTCRNTDGKCTCKSGWIGPSCNTGINYFKDQIKKYQNNGFTISATHNNIIIYKSVVVQLYFCLKRLLCSSGGIMLHCL